MKEKDLLSAKNFQNAIEQAWADIEANPLLVGLVEKAEFVEVEPRHDLDKVIPSVPAFRVIHTGAYDVTFYFPAEMKDEVRETIIDLGYTKKIVDVNCYLTLSEYFRLPNKLITERGTIKLCFYHKVEEGEKIGKNCFIGVSEYKLPTASLQCSL